MKSIFYTDIDEGPVMKIGVDSALHRPAEPLFLPDESHNCTILLVPTLRISRLGKCIPPAKAAEYYDAATVAAVFLTPASWGLQPLTADDTLTLGRWLPADSLPAEASAAVSALDGTLLQPAQKWPTGLTAHAAATAVAHASRHMTLKNGDVILLARAAYRIAPPQCDTLIDADLGAENVLSLKLK